MSSRDHFVALFLGAALYRQAKTCQKGERFATKLELAAGLVAELAPPPGTVLVAVADGAYARRSFVQPLQAQECHLVSPLRRGTPFFPPPPAPRQRQKSRPPHHSRH